MCDHGWDNADARVVCRQLGFGPSGRAYKTIYYGYGAGPILLTNVSCTGIESSLAECGYFDTNVGDCTHSNDAGVICSIQTRRK